MDGDGDGGTTQRSVLISEGGAQNGSRMEVAEAGARGGFIRRGGWGRVQRARREPMAGGPDLRACSERVRGPAVAVAGATIQQGAHQQVTVVGLNGGGGGGGWAGSQSSAPLQSRAGHELGGAGLWGIRIEAR